MPLIKAFGKPAGGRPPTGRGAGFKGAVGYNVGKAAQVEVRGLASIKTAAKEMRAVAANGNSGKPVYHCGIAWHPDEQPTNEQMFEAADYLAKRLGLEEHQRVLAIHRDRDHPHVHIVFNVVHPTTGKTASLHNNWAVQTEVAAELAEKYGWKKVELRREAGSIAEGELRRERRDGRLPFAETVQRHVAGAAAGSNGWDDLTARLAAHGLRLEEWRQGLVLTDGTNRKGLSKLDRSWSRKGLETRFGETYRDFLSRSAGATPEQPADAPPQRHSRDPVREGLYQEYLQQRQAERATNRTHQAPWEREKATRAREREELKQAQAQTRRSLYHLTRGPVRSAFLALHSWLNKRQWARLRQEQDRRWTAEKAQSGPPKTTTFRAFLEQRAAVDHDAARVLQQIRRPDLTKIYPGQAEALRQSLDAETRFHAATQRPPADLEASRADAIAAQREAVSHRRAFAAWVAQADPLEADRLSDQVKRLVRDQVAPKEPPPVAEPVQPDQVQPPRPPQPPTDPRQPEQEAEAAAATYRAWQEARALSAAANRRDRNSPEAVMSGIESARLEEAWWRWANQHPAEARQIEAQAKADRAATKGTGKGVRQTEDAPPAPPPSLKPETSIPRTAANRWPADPQQDGAEKAELEKAARSQIIAEIHLQRAMALQSELESGLVRRHLAGEPPEVIAQARDAILAKADPEAERRLDQVLSNEQARAEREQQPDRAAELEALRVPVTKRLQGREPPPAPKIDTVEQEKPRDRAIELQRELESGLVRRHLSGFTQADLARARNAVLQKGDPAAEQRLNQVLENEARRASTGRDERRLAEIEAVRQPLLDRLADRDSPVQPPPGRGPRRR